MSPSSKEANILEMPLEILERILNYVKDHLTVGQTCRTLYEISCTLRSYNITLHYQKLNRGICLDDLAREEKKLQDILSSKRKVIKIQIDFKDAKHFYSNIIKKLLERIGHDTLEFECENGYIKSSAKLFSLLNMMPNLQSIKFTNVYFELYDIPRSFQLNLPKLREIEIQKGDPEMLRPFGYLPDNTLQKVNFVDNSKFQDENEVMSLGENFLENQRSINEIDWASHYSLPIETGNLKLTSLDLREYSYLPEAIIGQQSLKRLIIENFLDQDDIDIISTLENLESLTFCFDFFLNLSSLQKLTKLVNLEFSDSPKSKETLATLKNCNLKVLDAPNNKFIDREDTADLILKCPNISKLTIGRVSSDALNEFLKSLKLEFLEAVLCGAYTFMEGLENCTLKRLDLRRSYFDGSVNDIEDFRRLFESCVKLKHLRTNFNDVSELFYSIHPRNEISLMDLEKLFTEAFIRQN